MEVPISAEIWDLTECLLLADLRLSPSPGGRQLFPNLEDSGDR